MDRSSPTLPVLTVHESYLLPVRAEDFGVCGECNYVAGCFDDCVYIDSTGLEWRVRGAEIAGYRNPFHRLIPRKYREVRVTFDFEIGAQYSLSELKSRVRRFLLGNKLRGQPFLNKQADIDKYLGQFTSVKQLISEIGFFDARHNRNLTSNA